MRRQSQFTVQGLGWRDLSLPYLTAASSLTLPTSYSKSLFFLILIMYLISGLPIATPGLLLVFYQSQALVKDPVYLSITLSQMPLLPPHAYLYYYYLHFKSIMPSSRKLFKYDYIKCPSYVLF